MRLGDWRRYCGSEWRTGFRTGAGARLFGDQHQARKPHRGPSQLAQFDLMRQGGMRQHPCGPASRPPQLLGCCQLLGCHAQAPSMLSEVVCEGMALSHCCPRLRGKMAAAC